MQLPSLLMCSPGPAVGLIYETNLYPPPLVFINLLLSAPPMRTVMESLGSAGIPTSGLQGILSPGWVSSWAEKLQKAKLHSSWL